MVHPRRARVISLVAATCLLGGSPVGARDQLNAHVGVTNVLGGTLEPDSQFPWVVRIAGTLTCHGVLIHDRWVLTAAHCVTGSFSGVKVSFTRTDPASGVVTNLSQNTGAGSRFLYPAYGASSGANDIALIKLPAPFPPSPFVRPAELPLSPPRAGQDLLVATESSTPGSAAALRGAFTLVGATSFAAESETSSLCTGDSGSGIVTEAGGMIFVTGITSLGRAGGCQAPSEEFIGTSVFAYLDWIRSFTGETGGGFTPAPADYDGDGKVDTAAKFDTGDWRIDLASNGFGQWDLTYPGYGATSVPVPADYDGDRKADLAIKGGAGEWYINFSTDGLATGFNVYLTGYGDTRAIPVPADYDGDGKADLAIKNSGGAWGIDYAATGFGAWDLLVDGYGSSTAIPVPADYDGDGKADLAIKNSRGEWGIDYARDGFGTWNAYYYGYGDATAQPVGADYDGDRKADLGIRDSGGTWLIDYASGGFGAWDFSVGEYGGGVSLPSRDYDGDRKADMAVLRGGIWYIQSTGSPAASWSFIVPIVF